MTTVIRKTGTTTQPQTEPNTREIAARLSMIFAGRYHVLRLIGIAAWQAFILYATEFTTASSR